VRPGCLVVLRFLKTAPAQQTEEPSALTLQQAVKIGLERNPLRKAALADTKVASADVREARSVLMPRLMFSETATGGNDPVYALGSELRQQRFTAADFALNKLNTPLPLGKFSTRLGGSWNLFDSFASWHAVNRAKHMNDAAGHQLAHTEQEIIFQSWIPITECCWRRSNCESPSSRWKRPSPSWIAVRRGSTAGWSWSPIC